MRVGERNAAAIHNADIAHLIYDRNGQSLSPEFLGDPFSTRASAAEVASTLPATRRAYPASAPNPSARQSNCGFCAIRPYFFRARGHLFRPLRNNLHPKRTASVSRAFGRVLLRNTDIARLLPATMPSTGFGRETLASATSQRAKLFLSLRQQWHIRLLCPTHPCGTAIAVSAQYARIPSGQRGRRQKRRSPSPRPERTASRPGLFRLS